MSTTEQSWRAAWEPLTPRGVAAFAGATLGRLLLMQLIVALIAAGSVGWFLEKAWFPVVRNAIRQLPERGKISGGQLDWAGDSPAQLAQNRFLGIAVDLYHSGQLGREAHLQVEFGHDDFRVYSLLGYEVFEYPPDWNVAFNRPELEPWWGAWEPMLMLAASGAMLVSLLVAWTVLATLYCAPVRVVSFLENRDLTWGQSWRLAGAAMMPGGLFMAAGIIAYTCGLMDLMRLGGVFGLHFIAGWIYLLIAPLFCPRAPIAKKTGANPFATSSAAPSSKKTADNAGPSSSN